MANPGVIVGVASYGQVTGSRGYGDGAVTCRSQVAGVERLGGDMQVGVLGSVEVWDGDDRVVSLTPQVRRLLGMLAATPGQTVSTDRIAEYVAGGSVDGSTVRTAVSRLRKVLGGRVATEQGGYRLILGNDDGLDSVRFEQLVAAARTMRPSDRRDALSGALGLWRGDAFAGLAEEPWAQAVVAHLDELRAVAVEDLAETLIEVGRYQEAVSLLEPQLDAFRYRERPVGLLMRALAADGRVTEALRAFQRFRTQLRDDIGIEPTSELRDLEASMLGGLDPERDVGIKSPAGSADGHGDVPVHRCGGFDRKVAARRGGDVGGVGGA